jgi:hypothetical protein
LGEEDWSDCWELSCETEKRDNKIVGVFGPIYVSWSLLKEALLPAPPEDNIKS